MLTAVSPGSEAGESLQVHVLAIHISSMLTHIFNLSIQDGGRLISVSSGTARAMWRHPISKKQTKSQLQLEELELLAVKMVMLLSPGFSGACASIRALAV